VNDCRIGRGKSRFLRGPALALAALMAASIPARGALAGDAVAFAVVLDGRPETGCIVTTDSVPCARNRVLATVRPDGASGFEGSFDLLLPGLRQAGPRVLRRGGRATLRGVFAASPDAEPVRCAFRGRVRVAGVLLPAGASTRRFHTGTFEARGLCAGEGVRLSAIWSGAIGNTSGESVFDFERFRGRLAGTMKFSDADGPERYELPADSTH
jgi:hypothetical protein